MANSCAAAAFLHPSASWQALLVFISVTAVRAADAGGQGPCPPFSCGDLHNISSPFRRPGDPPECGVQAYELACSRSKATIRINTGTYFVTSINYTDQFLYFESRGSFWVVDANLDMHSSCPLPRWDQLPYTSEGSYWRSGLHYHYDLATDYYNDGWACFINCSQSVTNSSWYKPVNCLSANNSFVYVMANVNYNDGCKVSYLEPSCGYLAMIPFGNRRTITHPDLENASYTDIIEYVRKGFSVRFPQDYYLGRNASWIFKTCRNSSTR